MRQSSFIISFLCLLQVSLNEVAAQYSCSSLSSCSSCTSYAYAGCGWCLTGNYCDSIYTSYCTTLTQYESYCPVDASRSGTGSTSSSSSNSAGAIAGSVVGVLVVVAAIAAFIWYRRRRRAMLYNHNNHREGDPLVKNNPPNATGNSNIWQSQSMEQPKQPVHLMTPTVMVSSPPIQQPMMQPCQPQPQTFQPVPMAPPLQPHQSFQPVPMAPPLQQQQQQQQSQPYSAGPVFSPYLPVPPPFAPPPAQNVQPFSPPVQSFATPPFQPIPVNPPPQQLQQQQPQPFQQYTPLPPPPMQAPPQFAPLPPPVPQRPTTNKDKEHDKDNNKDPKFPVAGAASTMAVGMYIQKDASVKAGEKREKDQEDNDASDDWNRAASIAIAGASVAGSLMPIFGILFDGIATICVMAANARTNQTNCRFMADRCKALEPILQAIQNHWRIIEADQSFEAQQKAKTMLPSFEGTVKEFHSTLLLLEKFSKLSKFQFIFKSSNVKEEFVQQDMRLTHAIETLSLGLTRENLQTSTQILNQLQNHLPYVQEKLDHVLTHVQELRVEQKVEIRAVAQAVEIRSQDVQNALASMKGHIMALKQAGLNKEPAFQEQQLHKLMQLQSNAGDRSPLPPSRSGGNLKHMNGFEIAEDEVELLSEIGRGSFGIVYKGKYRDQDVAVKKLILSGMDSSEARTDFFDEIQRLCSLRHNRLIQAYGACTDPTNPFVVMEWMPRKSLFHCLHSNEVTARPKLKHRLAMSMQLLEGITYLHLCKPTMVHRDIKSANLLVDNSFNCKISDFGLAKTLHQSSDSIAHRTADSSVAGTVAYAAPELFDDSAPPPSTASDMYSVGVVLWELWSNQIPWNQLSPMQIMNLVGIKKKMLSMETIRRPDSECPSELADLIEELMRPYPSERPTAPQSLKRLKAVYALLPPLHKAPVGKSPPPLSNYDSRGSSNSIDSHRSIASTVSMASSTASLDSAASSAQHSRASSIDSERGSLEFKPELKIPLQQLQRLSSEEQSNPASAF